MGELIWPKIFKRPTLFTREMRYHVELFLRSRGALIVHASSDPSAVIDRLAGSPYPPASQVPRVLRMFERETARSMIPVVGYDFSKQDIVEAVDHIIFGARSLEEWGHDPWQVTNHWVGSPHPGVMLVGDQPGPVPKRDQDPYPVPFRPYGGSSHYLMAALRETRLIPAITNVKDRRSRTPLRELWEAFEKPKAIALGNVAGEALTQADIKHGIAPHPQWVKRFKFKEMETYKRALVQAGRGQDGRLQFGDEVVEWKGKTAWD